MIHSCNIVFYSLKHSDPSSSVLFQPHPSTIFWYIIMLLEPNRKPICLVCNLDAVTFGSSAFRPFVSRLYAWADPWLSVPISQWVWPFTSDRYLVIGYQCLSSFLALCMFWRILRLLPYPLHHQTYVIVFLRLIEVA